MTKIKNYEIKDVVDLIISKYNLQYKDKKLNITKLHKLLYIVYGASISKNENLLFTETPVCLPYGPVFKTLNAIYKNGTINLETTDSKDNIGDSLLVNAIDSVLNTFGKYSATALSNWSHREDGAWIKAREETERWGNSISVKYIQDEFNNLIPKK